jgi:hypothetical protein
MAHTASHTPPPSIEQLQTVVSLLETPALARLYAYVLHNGKTTVSEVVEAVDIPQGTAYDYVRTLETAGLLTKATDNRPYEYEAEEITFTFSTDGGTRTITPTLIDAIAHRTDNGDIDVFVDRHGLDGLVTALEYAREYVDGTVNHRIMAREQDLSPLEAEIVLQALEPIVQQDRQIE